MYLAHPVMTAALRRVTRDIKTDEPVRYVLFSVFVSLCCIVVGKVYYELVERHFLNTSPKARAANVEPLPLTVQQTK
jgi:peptidoglycan/LPS O-acetylase OafA/YrhL